MLLHSCQVDNPIDFFIIPYLYEKCIKMDLLNLLNLA